MIYLVLFLGLAFAEPQLALTNITWSPAEVKAGDWVTLSTELTNTGDMPTTDEWTVVSFFINGSALYSYVHGPISLCDQIKVDSPVPFVARAGVYKVYGRADAMTEDWPPRTPPMTDVTEIGIGK